MDWITETVAIGNCDEARDVALLRREGIRSVVSLDGSLGEKEAPRLGLVEIVAVGLVDGFNDLRLFQRATHGLYRLVREAPPVLVHCHAGRSRSVAVVAGYLMDAQGIDSRTALARVGERRKPAVAPELVDLLLELE